MGTLDRGSSGMTIDSLDYRRLPGQNPLFLKYLTAPQEVGQFYPAPSLAKHEVASRQEKVLSGQTFSRDILVSSLEYFNNSIEAPSAARENLKALRSSDTVAVITGQHVGLFGGPALSIYKAATVISSCGWLRSQGIQAVPVFWLASEDSDFEEAQTTFFQSKDSELIRLRYPEAQSTPAQMAGTVELRQVTSLFSSLQESTDTIETAFTKGTLEGLQQSYTPDRTFRHAFGHWISHLFKDSGLLVFDPLSPLHRRHLAEFYSKAVLKREEVLSTLNSRSEQLQQQHLLPQVKVSPNETLLFYVQKTDRMKIRFEGGAFVAGAKGDHRWTEQELLSLIDDRPESFAPNALLRPLLQDYMFPTFSYVGGPAEVAYFAQVNSISHLWDLDVRIYPRSSFTLVDRKAQRLLGKYRLTIEDVMTLPRQALAATILKDNEYESLATRFSALEAQFSSDLRTLGSEIETIDPPLRNMVESAAGKIAFNLQKIRERFIQNRENASPHRRQHIDYLVRRLMPRGAPQERTINFNSFLAEEGPALLDQVIQKSEPFSRFHKVIYF
jgi:bacillithiol biosynthesis cysteine-adding enzyme BshC